MTGSVEIHQATSAPDGRVSVANPGGTLHLHLGSTFDRRDWQVEADCILAAGGMNGSTPRFIRSGEWKWDALTGTHHCPVKPWRPALPPPTGWESGDYLGMLR
jgi:hypothetical protein